MIAVDTNILVYTADSRESEKQRQATSLLTRLAVQPKKTLLLWQVACEFLNWLRRRERSGDLTSAEVQQGFIGAMSVFPLALPTPSVLDGSFELQEQFSLSHWDSLLLAACVEAGVDTRYSEDMAHGQKYDSVTVVNPFA